MQDINDCIADMFACFLQHGQNDTDMIFHFCSLEPENIFEGEWLNLYRTIVEYFRLTHKVIRVEEFIKFIQNSHLSQEEQNVYINLFNKLIQRQVNGDAFNFYLLQFKERFIFNKSYVMLCNANRALTSELILQQKAFKGYQGMRQYLSETMYDMDRLFAEYSPEGSVADDIDLVIEEYDKLKKSNSCLSTGFSALDKCTGGLFPGELWLWAGYAGEGKTSSAINIGHNVAFIQGKNVMYLTSETVKSVVDRRLISRHALHRFGHGIDLSAMKTGKLSDESFKILQKTRDDIKERNGEYGVFFVKQMPVTANVDFLAAVLSKYQSLFNIDLCILDSIHLLRAKRHRQSEYSELGDMLIEVKKIIVSHNKGKGVPLISPWHTNRASWEKAKECGHYTKSSLAKTGEAERCADVIVTILRENSGTNQLKGSIIKNRDGEELDEFYLAYNFNHCFVGNSQVDKAVSFDFSDVLNIN